MVPIKSQTPQIDEDIPAHIFRSLSQPRLSTSPFSNDMKLSIKPKATAQTQRNKKPKKVSPKQKSKISRETISQPSLSSSYNSQQSFNTSISAPMTQQQILNQKEQKDKIKSILKKKKKLQLNDQTLLHTPEQTEKAKQSEQNKNEIQNESKTNKTAEQLSVHDSLVLKQGSQLTKSPYYPLNNIQYITKQRIPLRKLPLSPVRKSTNSISNATTLQEHQSPVTVVSYDIQTTNKSAFKQISSSKSMTQQPKSKDKEIQFNKEDQNQVDDDNYDDERKSPNQQRNKTNQNPQSPNLTVNNPPPTASPENQTSSSDPPQLYSSFLPAASTAQNIQQRKS
ncbi:MAG: hypothetical protein EZS28_029143 [Streblomastix strix]|uniref:Uncharacterized protein n=1 Tax=Streblomastix strix TaxID=222440 RepID=A0A5J4UXV6_9EUKA|nr:MAG: hypothetical protein EZS28_029143 [Streblomastix strix]